MPYIHVNYCFYDSLKAKYLQEFWSVSTRQFGNMDLCVKNERFIEGKAEKWLVYPKMPTVGLQNGWREDTVRPCVPLASLGQGGPGECWGAPNLTASQKETQWRCAPGFAPHTLGTLWVLSLEKWASISPRKCDVLISEEWRHSRKRHRWYRLLFLGVSEVNQKRQTFQSRFVGVGKWHFTLFKLAKQ